MFLIKNFQNLFGLWITLLLAIAPTVSAETNIILDGVQTFANDMTSIYKTDAKYTFISGAVGTAFLYGFFKREFIDSTQNSFQKYKPLGSYSKYGDDLGKMIPNALYLGGMYTTYFLSRNSIYKHRAHAMFRSTLSSGVFTQGLKHIVRQRRPNNSASRLSFPSGHTTTAFAFAGTVSLNHEWYWSIPAYGIATLVALSRINDNAHYLHDVIGGAVIGISYSIGVDMIQKKSKSSVIFYPTFNDDAFGIAFEKNF